MTYYPFDAQLCELKFASWTTEVTRVRNRMMLLLLTAPQINMTIGQIDKEKILGLYSPSGKADKLRSLCFK